MNNTMNKGSSVHHRQKLLPANMFVNLPLRIGNNVQQVLLPIPPNSALARSSQFEVLRLINTQAHSQNEIKHKKVQLLQTPNTVCSNIDTAKHNTSSSGVPVSSISITPANLKMTPKAGDANQESNHLKDFYENLDTPKFQEVLHLNNTQDNNIDKNVQVFRLAETLNTESPSADTTNYNGSSPSVPVSSISATPANLKMTPKPDDAAKESNHLKDFYENFDTPEYQDLTMDETKKDTTNRTKSNFRRKFVRKKVTKRKLQTQFSNQIKTESGIYPTVMLHLKKVVEESKAQSFCKAETVCVILFDELVLDKYVSYSPSTDKIDGYVDLGDEGGRTEEIADRVLVFMLQNIKRVMKQPIAHYFFRGKITAEVLSLIITNVIRTVRKAGLTVIASVCDQAPSHVEALNLLKGPRVNCVDLNFYFIDDKIVYIIYDVPHLFKSIRNNLIRYGELVMDNKVVKLSHLNMVEAKNSSTLHFTKITKEHVNEINWSKRGIKLAIEILSNTVSGVLKALSESKVNVENKNEILESGDVVEDLDTLFDCTNGSFGLKGKKKIFRATVFGSSFHHSLWVEYKRKLKNTHFLNTNGCVKLNDVRCINGFIITISSLQDIWKYIEQKRLNSLNLNCLNLNSLEDLLKFIEYQKPQNQNHLTCHHYEFIVNTMLLALFNSSKKKKKCENANDDSIMSGKNLDLEESDSTAKNGDELSDCQSDENYIQPKSENGLEKLFNRFDKHPNVYISAYLAVKLLKNATCERCCDVIEVTEIENDHYHSYILLRDVWREKCPLVYPSKNLCMTVEKATKIFNLDVKPILYIKNILNYCVTAMLTECDVTWMCEEHRTVMSKRLFNRLGCLLIRNHCRLQNKPIANIKETSRSPNKKNKLQETTIQLLQFSDLDMIITNS